jgi:hypothetical protein
MKRARRLSAATLVLVLALWPVALERCRTTCVSAGHPATHAASDVHACDAAAAGDDDGARMDPLARACGHSDGLQTYDSVKRLAGKSRTAVLAPAGAQLAQHLQAGMSSLRGTWPPGRIRLPRALLPLHSPLRL